MSVNTFLDNARDGLPTDGGFRVIHPTKRMAFEVIVDPKRPYKDGFVVLCPTCNVGHPYKTYHIILNAEGIAVLSPEVYRRVMDAYDGSPQLYPGHNRLRLMGHTKTPPTQVVGTKKGVMGPIPQRDKTVVYHH